MQTHRYVWLAIIISLTSFGLWLRFGRLTALSPVELLAEAKSALLRREYDLAEELAIRILPASDYFQQSRLVAGEAAKRSGRSASALKHYATIPRDGTRSSVLAALAEAEIQTDMGHLSNAEQNYQYALRHQPENLTAHRRIALLFSVTGRRWESRPHLWFLLRSGVATLDDLILIGDLERIGDAAELIQQWRQNPLEEPLVVLATATQNMMEGSSIEARHMLQQVVDAVPNLLAAQTMLGELLIDADGSEFIGWHRRLPNSADSYADTWYVRGRWARRQGSLRVAARCFWESIRIEPTHRRSTFQLGQTLVALGENRAQLFADQASKQFQLSHLLNRAMVSKGKDQAAIQRAVSLLEDCGRLHEAKAWATIARSIFPGTMWPADAIARLSFRLDDSTPMVIDAANLALKCDLSDFPWQPELFQDIDEKNPYTNPSDFRPRIWFDESTAVGLDFAYVNGSDPLVEEVAQQESSKAISKTNIQTRLRIQDRTRVFEQGGGGVAAFDFDGDGWQDLFFSQGSEWKHGTAGPTFSDTTTDRLFRNLNGQSFINVTPQALQIDQGFGQGCAAGDFDNDGFVDLYIANIGRNQLYKNNGDGTFSDVTASCGIEGTDWTSSCMIVDLNADSLPDLFDVNYLSGTNVYEAVCKHACSPKMFAGTPDRLYLNCGNGTFEFIPNACPTEGSKGLGVIAFEQSTRGRPSLFIANDQVPNFLLQSIPSHDRYNIRMENTGFASGLAFNEDGLAMASMGIAADDINGDGRIDFFVTTFKDEPRVLYIQDVDGLFADVTRTSGLRGPGLPFVGWGTQFLDADRDGDPDLVAVNGHVADYRRAGGEYHMRAQFFHNAGGARFIERFAPDVGAFFEQKRLGRGLARLDWNRDGRMDFVVNNIGEQATLVTNNSTGLGHFLNIRLHAQMTARDAIGSVVNVITENRRWSKQLLAGDGYMACNERMLQFGLGGVSVVTELQVYWPSGSVTTMKAIPTDVTVELVEGKAQGILRSALSDKSLVAPASITHE